MKILLGIGGFFAAIIIAAAVILLIIAVAKGKIGTTGIKTPAKWLVWVIILAVIGFAGYWVYEYFSKSEPGRQTAITESRRESQEWQLCWLKTPEYEGKTDIRQKCLPAQIETRSDSHIVVSYTFSGGKGVREGTSIDGKNYSGQWKDKTGWGNFHMEFISPDTAFGWSDDESSGDKQPSVFERKK